MRQIGRRQFLYCVGGIGALAGMSSAVMMRSREGFGEATTPDELRGGGDLSSVTRSSWALGSTVSITAVHSNESQANRALDAAFAELELVEQLMSIYRADSQLARLNRDQRLDDPHPYLLDVLQAATSMSEKTDGAFDITIQPLWELYATARKDGQLPSDAQVEAARGLVDWRRVERSSDHVRLRGAGTKITLNGIAQGFAADRVTKTLRNHGIEHALIDTGEIGTLGAKPDDNGWTIGIQHPRDEQAYLSLAKLAGRCLATSGDYATSFSPDHEHHHLFDPRTGHSPAELASVSIAANSALEADALSTAVFVMGIQQGSALIRKTPGADAMLVSKDGRTVVTSQFPVA